MVILTDMIKSARARAQTWLPSEEIFEVKRLKTMSSCSTHGGTILVSEFEGKLLWLSSQISLRQCARIGHSYPHNKSLKV